MISLVRKVWKLSQHTLKAYRLNLALFLEFALEKAAVTTLTEVNRDLVQRWLAAR